jgi:hypothetical protein
MSLNDNKDVNHRPSANPVVSGRSIVKEEPSANPVVSGNIVESGVKHHNHNPNHS